MSLVLAIWGVCICGQGCGPITLAARTVVIEPIHDWVHADDVLEQHRDYKLADQAWQAIAQEDPKHLYSPDFVHGFKEGFADYVYAGGSGEPPPLPPRYYWKESYETPQGHRAIADWFTGFRLGAELARESGYREWVMIPSALLRTEAVELPLAPSGPAPSPLPAGVPELPPPRKLVPGQVAPKSGPDDRRPAASPPAAAGTGAPPPAMPPP
jgi:hypothetical protein